MVGSVGGPQFHQPSPFEPGDEKIKLRNTKHALSTLKDGLSEVQEGVDNAAPRLIISGSKQVENAMSVIKKNIEALSFDSLDAWEKLEPELSKLKDLCNSGSMNEVRETIDHLHTHIEELDKALEAN